MKETQTDITLENLIDFKFKPIIPTWLTLECNATLKLLMNNHYAHYACLKQKQKVNVVKRMTINSDVSDNKEDKHITSPSQAQFIVY